MPTPCPQPRPSSRNIVPAAAAAGNASAATTVATTTLMRDGTVPSVFVRRLLFLTSAVVFFDTLFFAALTPLLPHYVHQLHMGKAGAGVLAAAYPAGALVGAPPPRLAAGR